VVPRKRSNRTQAERSEAMRARLLQATVDCLVDLGYANTTTTAVVERAGVSRGAVLHHFPTKADLVADAVGYVLEKRSVEFKDSFADLPQDEGFMDSVVMALWHEINGPTFYAWMELIVAARTDAELRRKVVALGSRWSETLDATFRAIFQVPRSADRHPLALAPIVTIMIMEGLALERIARPSDTKLEKRVLRALKTMAPLITLESIAVAPKAKP
jgi:AcrR family transcriptional regulator